MNVSSINLPGANSSVNAQTGSRSTGEGQNTTRNTKVEELINSSSPVDKRQAALQIVNKTLAAAYEKISSRSQSASIGYQAFEPLTAEKVASNILGFIERRLQLDVADGATAEQLQARLEAGLAGFKKGFAEASEKLEALSLLSPEIKADIGKTYDLVLSGVDELRKKFIGAVETPQPASEQAGTQQIQTATTTKPSTTLQVPEFLPAAKSSSVGYGNYEYGRAREFSFQLTTREGDKITIKASSSEGFAVEAGRATRGGVSSAVNGSYSSSRAFSLQVEGDLSEEELTAINDLLARVNDLAGQFFAGNLDEAFQQALNLGYDETQIGSFALNLAQAEIQQVTRAYQVTTPRVSGDNQNNRVTVQLLPMGEFIRDLLDSLSRASMFDEPKTLVADIAEKITGTGQIDEEQGKRFRVFVEQILGMDLR